MVAFNFQEQFAGKVQRGKKRRTIRGGSWRCRAGDKIQLYTGQRTKKCRKLGNAVCTGIYYVRISEDRMSIGMKLIRSKILLNREARRDGFKNYAAMTKFFFANKKHASLDWWGEIYYSGYMYTWKLAK